MIERILRRLTVRRRIIGGFLALVLLLALSLPLVVTNYRFLVGRLQQVTNVDARADRALLLASARIASSRINLMRYVQDYAPSPYTVLDDVDQATGLLEEAQRLITSGSTAASPEQKASVEAILVKHVRRGEVRRPSGSNFRHTDSGMTLDSASSWLLRTAKLA
jgi:hypothetical protein